MCQTCTFIPTKDQHLTPPFLGDRDIYINHTILGKSILPCAGMHRKSTREQVRVRTEPTGSIPPSSQSWMHRTNISVLL